MSVSLSPSGIIYEGTLLVITCNATVPSVVDTSVSATVSWTGPNGIIKNGTGNGRITVDQPVSVGDNVFQSLLTFRPVDNGDMISENNDVGSYTCEMNVSSSDSLILSGTNSITEEIAAVTALPDLEVSISTSGSTEVGQSLNITCSVVLVEGLVADINITWDMMDGELEDLNLLIVTAVDGPVTNVTLILDPVQFNYRGVYLCHAMFNVTQTADSDSSSQTVDLIVNFPPFDVTISQDYTHPLYTGTNLTLSCGIVLSSLVDISVIVSNYWTRNGTAITDDTITSDLTMESNLNYTATLEFYPLYHLTDDGEYQCNVTVGPSNPDNYIVNMNISNSASTTLDVLDLPAPIVTVSRSSLASNVAEPLEFVCSVSVVERLIVSPEIIWTKYVSSVSSPLPDDDISVDAVRTDNQLSLDFNSLNTSDAGRYTCEADVTIPQINVTRSNDNYQTLSLQIPAPEVTVTRSQTDQDSLLAGSSLTIYCDISIDQEVNTPFTVITNWTRQDNDDVVETLESASDRVIVYSPYSTGYNTYQSRIEFSTLSSLADSGVYTCSVLIESNSSYTFVYDSDDSEDTTTLAVNDPVISNFSAFPKYFLGLETTCTDSDPFDTFTLNCTASKPSIVLPELELFWLHNGTVRTNNSITYSMTLGNDLHKLTVLSFPESTVEDSGTYECIARLVIPDSQNITRTDQSTVTITAARRPYAATNVATTVSTTSVIITFTIPAIAYTPETYHIEYIGLELQNDLTNSTMLSSKGDIAATDQNYTITITGLEESNTYNYTVVSTNCQGQTRTPTYSFTTNPTAPNGTVNDCRNVTFNSRNVTLDWEPPLRQLQNGELTGYLLMCQEEGSDVPVPNTNDTEDSLDTEYTIPIITPFRSYNCAISAINTEGIGPETFCVFDSAQDIPSDTPQNFTSIAEQFSATFTWTAPTIPNGVITQYNLTVIVHSTTRGGTYESMTFTVPASDATTTYSRRVTDLLPYQDYTATVTASTIIGYGPEAITNGRTEPDDSSIVRLYTVPANGFPDIRTLPAVNSTTLNVTWRPPVTPNGNITSYQINVVNRKDEPNQNIVVRAVDEQEYYTQLVTGLNPGTPYYITIGAVNELGVGNTTTVTAFSAVASQPAPPENVTTQRSDDGTEVTVTWIPPTLEQAGGYYMVVCTITERARTRQTMNPITVPYTESSATFTGLEPSSSYTVTVATATVPQEGEQMEGPTAEPVPAEPNPEHTTAEPTESSNLTPIIAGVVGGIVAVVLVLIIIVVIVIIVIYRRKSSKESYSVRNDLFLSPTNGSGQGTALHVISVTSDNKDVDIDSNGGGRSTSFSPLHNEPDPADDEEDPKKKMLEEDMAYLEAEKSIDRSKPIAKASFHEHVQTLHEDADKEYEQEYKSVPMSTDSSFDIGKSEVNKSKNRFANIFPYDFSRVQLPALEDTPGSDYINASFVDGYNKKDCYVCAQGPLPTTLADFWKMIWERKITNLVMLTGVVEGGKKKCEQYWPEGVGQSLDTHGGLLVTMTSKVPFSDYTIHSLRVTKPDDKESAPLDVTHFHFTAWPDHGVPQFATSLIGFINRVQKSHDKSKGVPLLVHCSAGVGRTGTFVMLDSMMERLRVEDSLNVYEFLKQMRSKRMYMVQTLAQYVFVHDALDEYITCGETDISASNLKVRVAKMHKIVPSKNITGFQEQFQLLEQVGYAPNEAMYSDASKPFNAQKNRYPDILPLNLNRPRLRPDGSDGSDYINASFVDGYKQRNAYLVTQGPLKNTVEDFWRMIVEFKSRSIIMLCNTVEEGEEKCYMFWPTKEGEPVQYDKHKVTLQSETVNGDYIVRKLLVQNEKSSAKAERDGIVVTQFHYTQWPEHGHPTITGQVIEMIDTLTRNQMNTGNKPITVICNNGVGRSGAFLCIHSQLERLKTEGEVDVFKYLKSARTKRIGLVSEIDYYVFIHEVLADYVESFDPYANFKN